MTPPDASDRKPPRPPDRPDEGECCNRGCCPCIFDYYEDAVIRWEAMVRRLGFDPDRVMAEKSWL